MTPLHPLVVHLPLALAVVVPVLAIGALFYAWRRGISRRAWAVVFLLQAGLVAGGFAALSTGEADEHRVERVVAESAIERHEESGERFVWASAGVLGLMLLPLLTRRATLRRATIGVAAAGSVATVALAVDPGHKGGELVYENGAALAYALAGMEGDVDIDARERFPKHFANVLGKRMACVDVGTGDPIVFLHGNPTSSYLWRNIIPHLMAHGRCIAPDLIGMGDSEKLDASGPDSYRFVEHRRYLDALLEQLGVTDRVTFVVHDWGSALGFDWANRHREAVKGIAYMEALVRPVSWENWPRAVTPTFQAFRSPAGDEMILDNNAFVEQVLPMSIMRKLGVAEKNAYGRPYLARGEDRRPTLTWPREIPIDGQPADVVEIVQAYADWLETSDLPKLLINAEPGAILRGEQLEFCRRWSNQQEITVKGIHFIQEDSPDEIGQAIENWYQGL